MSPCVVRGLTAADVEAADVILKAAYGGADSRAAMLRRFLALDAGGWRVAIDGTTLVGCVGAVDYGGFAYVGMMAVRPDAQRRGIGRALMQDVLAWIARRGTATVLLDATPAGAPLYASLGFESEDDACFYTRAAGAGPTAPTGDAIALGVDDVERIGRLDTPIFGANRERLLGLWLAAYPGRAFGVLDHGGEIAGFVIAQEQRIGPWVAREAAIAEILLAAALSLPFADTPTVIAPGVNTAVRAMLGRHGFSQTGGTRHMRRGPAVLRERASICGQVAYATG
jgi:predicted N-acetyltransferase YhbS